MQHIPNNSYQSKRFCQTKPICRNGDVCLFIHPVYLVADISPIINFLEQHAKAPGRQRFIIDTGFQEQNHDTLIDIHEEGKERPL